MADENDDKNNGYNSENKKELSDNVYKIRWSEKGIKPTLVRIHNDLCIGDTPREAYKTAFRIISACAAKRSSGSSIGGLFFDYEIQLKDGRWYKFWSSELEAVLKESEEE